MTPDERLKRVIGELVIRATFLEARVAELEQQLAAKESPTVPKA